MTAIYYEEKLAFRMCFWIAIVGKSTEYSAETVVLLKDYLSVLNSQKRHLNKLHSVVIQSLNFD